MVGLGIAAMNNNRDWLALAASFAGPAIAVGLAVWGWGGAVTGKLDALQGKLDVEIQARTDSTAALASQMVAVQGDVTALRAAEGSVDKRLSSVEAAVYPALQPQVLRRR